MTTSTSTQANRGISAEYATKLSDIAKKLYVSESDIIEILLKKYKLAPEDSTPITFDKIALQIDENFDTLNLAVHAKKQCQCRNNRGQRCNKKTGLKLAKIPFNTQGNALIWMCSEHVKSGQTQGPHQGPMLFKDFHPRAEFIATLNKV
ncbi:MAG: hypothetical protein ACJAW8_002033 [Oleispira sp.]|jgi:hypothetical protein